MNQVGIMEIPYEYRDRHPVMCYPMPVQAPILEDVYDSMELHKASISQKCKAMYLHIPFCEYLCSFCPFVKYLKDEEKVQEYLDALKKEVEFYSASPYFKSSRFGSLYMGGGTASCLSTNQLVDLLSLLKKSFIFADDAEITLESNPQTVSLEKFQAVRKVGVNRVSFGVQTFNDKIGSETDVAQDGFTSKQAIQWAIKAGIENVSIDLIYNLPGQQAHDLLKDIDIAIEIGVKQITLFPLSVMNHTVLAQKVKAGKVKAIGELRHELDLCIEATQYIKKKGYVQTSVVDFSDPQSQYRHARIHFHDFEDLLGLGAGAMGSVNEYTYVNVGELNRYFEMNNQKLPPINAGQKTPEDERARALLTMGLRLISIDRNDFQKRFGTNPEDIFGDTIERLKKKGLLEVGEQEIRLTELGILFCYNVAKEFYSDEIRNRGQKLAESLARKKDITSN